MSGTYQIDGVNIPKPTTGKWEQRDELGRDGLGKPIYGSVRSFRLVWEYLSPEDANTLYALYKAKESTGSYVVSLPAYDDLYNFKTYSGTYLTEPEYAEFFETHVSNFGFLVVNIRG